MSKNLVNLAILVAIIGFAVIAGFVYLSGSEDPTQSVVSQGPSALGGEVPAGDQGASTMTTLSSLRKISIDLSLFDDTRFKGLTDYSTQLPTIGKGRENPFSPLGVSSEGSSGGNSEDGEL